MLSDCQNLNRLTGNRGRLHSAHWLASSLKLAARCPVIGCWPSCYFTQNFALIVKKRVDQKLVKYKSAHL